MRLVSTGASFSGTKHRADEHPWVIGEWASGQVGTGPHPGTTKLRWGGKGGRGVEKGVLVLGFGNTSNHLKCREEGPGRAREAHSRPRGTEKSLDPAPFGMSPTRLRFICCMHDCH